VINKKWSVSIKIFSSTTVFCMDNNKKCVTKSAY